MAKKSFLEILTGGEVKNEVPVEKNHDYRIPEYEYSPVSYNVPTNQAPQEKKEESKDKGWFEEENEGQLTVDVYQTPNEIVIKSAIAGIKDEDIDVTITNDMVTIKGKRNRDDQVRAEDYYYQELYWGSFSRSIILPTDIEAERASAALKDGILTIRLPKIEKVRTRKIKVMSI